PDGGAFHFDSYSIKKNSRNLEKYLIVKTLDQTGGNKTRAASLLEISVPTILYKMKEFGLGKSE
ncbi:MAG: helix-turn-helix domain-containing protein, partial [Desulfobulbaceae bacterium]|nr:helix-turn-helix domain-containing protein [Desulfobulbaceae bacterium]